MEAGQGCCSYPYPLPQQPQHILPHSGTTLPRFLPTQECLSITQWKTYHWCRPLHQWLFHSQQQQHSSQQGCMAVAKAVHRPLETVSCIWKKSLDYKPSYLVSVNRHTSVSTAAILKGKPYLSGYHVTRFLVNTLKYHSSFFMLMGPKCFIFKQQMYFPICQDWTAFVCLLYCAVVLWKFCK